METLTALLKSIGGKLEESSKNSKSSKDSKIVAEYYKRMDKMKENAVSQQLVRAGAWGGVAALSKAIGVNTECLLAGVSGLSGEILPAC